MTYTVGFAASLIGAASLAGLLGALLGVGGGIFIVPVMVLGFHLPIKIAVAASIVSVIATSNAGGSSYVDQRITNLRLAMYLEIATTIGALSGSVLALYLREWVMLLVFAAMLAYMAYAAFSTRNLDDRRIRSGDFARGPQGPLSAYLGLRGDYHDAALHQDVHYIVKCARLGGLIAYMAGVSSGLLGVGGGVLKVSAMNKYMNVPMKVAVGTSKLMIGVTAAVGSILFFLAGLIHFAVVAPVALGTTLGATAGTMVMNRLHSQHLKWLFAVLMVYLAYGMVAEGLDLRFHLGLPRVM